MSGWIIDSIVWSNATPRAGETNERGACDLSIASRPVKFDAPFAGFRSVDFLPFVGSFAVAMGTRGWGVQRGG